VVSLEGLQREIARRLATASDTPQLDSQVLLAHGLGVSRSWVLAHPEKELSAGQERWVAEAVSRLEAGEPLPYVLGSWEFFGLQFNVNPAVLIPRPETELLVEKAISWLAAHSNRRLGADIGTGSGCIAVSLAKHIPDLLLLATDISQAALEVARGNARRHGVEQRIHFVQADLLRQLQNGEGEHEQVSGSFSLLCANLPYIPEPALDKLKVSRSEPRLALSGGPDGLASIRRLLELAPQYMSPGGLILLEIEETLGKAALGLARKAFPAAALALLQDLAGKDRLLQIEL
jgi:release factor glutamine methyltransferase